MNALTLQIFRSRFNEQREQYMASAVAYMKKPGIGNTEEVLSLASHNVITRVEFNGCGVIGQTRLQ